MALESILAVVKATLHRERQVQKHYRYLDEERRAERMRQDLESCNREQWLTDTLETEETLG